MERMRYHHMTLLNTGIACSGVIRDLWKRLLYQLAQNIKNRVGYVEKMIHDHLHTQKLSVRWVPRLPIFFQKQVRVHCFKTYMYQENYIFDRLITQ